MRQIKFRAWDKDNQYMNKWDQVKQWSFDSYEQSSIALMQYTGLTDKNGTPIYEGDIIGLVHITYDEEGEWAWDSVHEVVWGGEDYPAFDIKPNLYCEENGLSHLACSPEAPHYEVIGNKFEDKHLLE